MQCLETCMLSLFTFLPDVSLPCYFWTTTSKSLLRVGCFEGFFVSFCLLRIREEKETYKSVVTESIPFHLITLFILLHLQNV